MSKKIELLEKLHFLVRASKNSKESLRRNIWCLQKIIKKLDISPREKIFSVCKKIIRKLIDNFFKIIDLGSVTFGNGSLFNQMKENSPLIKHFGPMYLDFYEYPPYSGRIYALFEKNVNENIQCDHVYAYSSGKQKIYAWVNE